jgi:uncharacterized BrkB/YihY/UPF0761 family membrane protein
LKDIFLFMLLVIYVLVNFAHNCYLGMKLRDIWDNIEQNGFKVKHLLNLIFFLPSWLLAFVIILLMLLCYLISQSKIWRKLKDLSNTVIWIKKEC